MTSAEYAAMTDFTLILGATLVVLCAVLIGGEHLLKYLSRKQTEADNNLLDDLHRKAIEQREADEVPPFESWWPEAVRQRDGEGEARRPLTWHPPEIVVLDAHCPGCLDPVTDGVPWEGNWWHELCIERAADPWEWPAEMRERH